MTQLIALGVSPSPVRAVTQIPHVEHDDEGRRLTCLLLKGRVRRVASRVRRGIRHRQWEGADRSRPGRVHVVARAPKSRTTWVRGDGWPVVLPMSYLLDGGDIVLRSDAGMKLSALRRGARVSFQVDSVDPVHRVGLECAHLRAKHRRGVRISDQTAPVAPALKGGWSQGLLDQDPAHTNHGSSSAEGVAVPRPRTRAVTGDSRNSPGPVARTVGGCEKRTSRPRRPGHFCQ
jgi:hypothetical protein